MNTETKGLIKRTVKGLPAQILDNLRSLRSVSERPARSREPLQDEIAARQIIIAEAQCQIAALKSRQNELLPIHRLPVEVLSIILSMALPLEDYHKERTKLLLVCRTWSNIIDGCLSTFWTTLSTDDPRSQRTRLVQKAGQKLVTVFMGDYHASYQSGESFTKYIKSNNVLFRELVVRERNDNEMETVFQDCLAAPDPHLRSLDLEARNGWLLEGGNPSSMFSGVAPNLKSVRLFGVCIPWNSAILRGLHSFSLECPDYCAVGTPSLEDVLRILQDCPALQSLTLRWRNTYAPDHFSQSAKVLPRVSLDQLESINISTSSLQSNLVLLRHIRFPITTTVRIEVQYLSPQEGDDEILDATLSLLRQDLSIETFQLCLYGSHLRFSATGLEFSIRNQSSWKHEQYYRTYRAILFRLSSPIRAAITSLDMGCSLIRDPTDPLRAANESLPNLSHLLIHHPARLLKSASKPWNVVLEEMVQPIEDTGRPTWLCPQLTCLELRVSTAPYSDDLDLAAILELVRMRNSDVVSNGKQVIKSPITTIHITSVYDGISPDQMDLLNELKSEVAEIQYVIEAQSEYDTEV